MCVFTFDLAPPANATIEVKCRCRSVSCSFFVSFKATLNMSPIKMAWVALSMHRPVMWGPVISSGSAGCSGAAGALDTSPQPTPGSVAADGVLFVWWQRIMSQRKICSGFSAVTCNTMEANWILGRFAFIFLWCFYSSEQEKCVQPCRFYIIIQAA